MTQTQTATEVAFEQSDLREQKDAVGLQTVSLERAIDFVGADTIRLAKSNLGKDYIHLLNGTTGKWLSIGLSAKLNLGDASDDDKVNEVMGNEDIVIYAGIGTSGNKYYTFGPKPTSKEAYTVALADVMNVSVN
jgi:hypothetical protein